MPLTTYSVPAILGRVNWTVEVTGEFETWWNGLSEGERVSIDGMIHVLEAHGPSLGSPYSIPVGGSRYAQLRQLLVPHHGGQICVLYISDEPRSRLVLLTGTTTRIDEEVCPPKDIERADFIYNRYVAGRRSPH
jgi:hypothetical protein